MSVFIDKECETLNLNKDYGIVSRAFHSTVRMTKYFKCDACLFMVYVSNKMLPNRKSCYRNHFILYMFEDTLVVALTETLLEWGPDILPVIEYDVIKITKCKKNVLGNWHISYDKIKYSSNLEEDLKKFKIVSSGEWWYFDKGRILNGIDEYSETSNSFFIYYELFPSKITISSTNEREQNAPRARSVISSLPEIRRPPDIVVSNSCTDTTTITNDFMGAIQMILNNQDEETTMTNLSPPPPPPLPSVAPPSNDDTIVETAAAATSNKLSTVEITSIPITAAAITTSPLVDESYLPLVQNVVKETRDYSLFQSVLPSSYWLAERETELKRCDIRYFIPSTSSCDSF